MRNLLKVNRELLNILNNYFNIIMAKFNFFLRTCSNNLGRILVAVFPLSPAPVDSSP